MPVVIISGKALAYANDPRNEVPITDPSILARFHGVVSDDHCSTYLEDPKLAELGIEGGHLRIVFDASDNGLRVVTAYNVARQPSAAELQALIDETVSQWSDGVGCGSFVNHNLRVHSAALAMALLNSGQTRVGKLFIDVYPTAFDQEVQVVFHEQGHCDDELVADLIRDANDGNLAAMTTLGQRFQAGDGVEQNDGRAFELFSQAADGGEPFAIVLLGICYENGHGCTQDLDQARRLFQRAAEMDYPLAMHCLGEMYEPTNPAESVALYKRGAALGDPGCTAALGDCFEFGKGVEVDLDEALACYERCMEMGFDAVEEAIQRIASSRSK